MNLHQGAVELWWSCEQCIALSLLSLDNFSDAGRSEAVL